MTESLLFLLTSVIGFITIIIMVTTYKSNQFFNIFLMVVFIMTSIRYSIHGSYELGLQLYLKPDRGASSIIYLIIAPCFYLYQKNLVNGIKTFNLSDLKHFIFIPIFYLINTIPAIQDSYIFYYGVITNLVIITLFLMFYLWLVLHTLKNNLWHKKDIQIHSNHFNLVKKWTIYLFGHNTLVVMGILISIYTEFALGITISGKYMFIIILLSWLTIYFKILISPEILYGLPILNKKLLLLNKPIVGVNNSWKLSSPNTKGDRDVRLQENIKSNIHSYVGEMDRLSYEICVFRNSKLSLSDVANEMGVPTSHLVYLFKYHSKISFSEYRMHSRIQDAINLIHNDYLKLNTLESLSYKTGFSSYTPFFGAFKKVTKLPPQEYLKSQKNSKA